MIVSQVLDELGISLDHELADITPGLEKPVIQTKQAVSISTVILSSHLCFLSNLLLSSVLTFVFFVLIRNTMDWGYHVQL